MSKEAKPYTLAEALPVKFDGKAVVEDPRLRATVEALQLAQADNAALKDALEAILRVHLGFAEAVRNDSGKAYPWAPFEHEEPKARALLAKIRGGG